MKEVKKPDDVPAGPHYAVIVYGTIAHDDGYGGTTDSGTAAHYVTSSRDEWLKKIEECEARASQPYNYDCRWYVALEVKGKAQVQRRFVVDVR